MDYIDAKVTLSAEDNGQFVYVMLNKAMDSKGQWYVPSKPSIGFPSNMFSNNGEPTLQVLMWAEPLPVSTFSPPTSSSSEAVVWVPASPMVVMQFPERPQVVNIQQTIMVSIPVDSRIAFANARRRLLQDQQQQEYLYNPAGTIFGQVQAFWFSAELQAWQPFERQSVKPTLFKIIVPVSPLLLSNNQYRLQMAVFGVPVPESSDRRAGTMLPEDGSGNEIEWPVGSTRSLSMTTTVSSVETTKAGPQTSTTPAPPPPPTAKSDNNDVLVAVGGAVGGSVAFLLLLCLWCRICGRRRRGSGNQDCDEDDDESGCDDDNDKRGLLAKKTVQQQKSLFAVDSFSSGNRGQKKWD